MFFRNVVAQYQTTRPHVYSHRRQNPYHLGLTDPSIACQFLLTKRILTVHHCTLHIDCTFIQQALSMKYSLYKAVCYAEQSIHCYFHFIA